ncbi:hypothetical protein [Anaerosporobacter sp.]
MTNKQDYRLLGAIDRKELVEEGAIYFERIEEGFRQYQCKVIEGTEAELKNMVRALWEDNGKDHAYVDWYYGTLLPEEQERIRNVLSITGREALKHYEKCKELLFLPLTEELFELTMEFNLTESLFCTYYFCKQPCTVWGNYDNKFQCFYK